MSDVKRYWVATQALYEKEWVGIEGLVVSAGDHDAKVAALEAEIERLSTRNEALEEQAKHNYEVARLAADQTSALRAELAALKDAAGDAAPSGYDALWNWFGLSRAAWLTLPRVLMHSMPDEWQRKMAALLAEWDGTWSTGHLPAPEVRSRVNGRLSTWPEWVLSYRHPDRDAIAAHRAGKERPEQPPANCRQRLVKEGKPYPRSSCQACGKFSPKWKECDAALSRQPNHDAPL